MLNVLNVKFVASGIVSFVGVHIKAIVAKLGIYVEDDMMMVIIELRNQVIILLSLFRQ
jgi:hypothetical protein